MNRLRQHVMRVGLGVVMSLSLLVSGGMVHAQTPAASPCPFGQLEVPLPGQEGKTVCEVVESGDGLQPFCAYIGYIANLLVALIVATGLIMVVVGGYFYMTAGGSADRVSTGKKFIGGALLGITLGLGSYIILRTVNPDLLTCRNVFLPQPAPEVEDASGRDFGGPSPVATPTSLRATCTNVAFPNDGILQSGVPFAMTVTIRNDDTVTWRAGTDAPLLRAVNSDLTDWGVSDVTLPHDVAPGETIDFVVTAVAPTVTEPTARFLSWQLVGRDGTALGNACPQIALVLTPQFTPPPAASRSPAPPRPTPVSTVVPSSVPSPSPQPSPSPLASPTAGPSPVPSPTATVPPAPSSLPSPSPDSPIAIPSINISAGQGNRYWSCPQVSNGQRIWIQGPITAVFVHWGVQVVAGDPQVVSCTASGSWSGTRQDAGFFRAPSTNGTYTLTCPGNNVFTVRFFSSTASEQPSNTVACPRPG